MKRRTVEGVARWGLLVLVSGCASPAAEADGDSQFPCSRDSGCSGAGPGDARAPGSHSGQASLPVDGSRGGETGLDARLSGGGAADGSTPGRADAGPPTRCPEGLEGPVLVRVPAPAGSPVPVYCIDSTEVTRGQYDVFLSAGHGPQDPWCSGNSSYVPAYDALGPDYPVMGVDWCDAVAYCRWAGKHLCGKITAEPEGERLGPADFANPAAAEWFSACSAGGTQVYPYGDTFDMAACNAVEDITPGSERPVASFSTCEGGYPGIFDLAGNVLEWEDSCTGYTSGAEQCATRGGWVLNASAESHRCDTARGIERNMALGPLGFRCCASAI